MTLNRNPENFFAEIEQAALGGRDRPGGRRLGGGRRSAYTLYAEDDDFTQPGTLVREVFGDFERDRLVDQVAGSLLGGVREPVLSRAFAYWKNVDADVEGGIEAKVRAGAAPRPAEG